MHFHLLHFSFAHFHAASGGTVLILTGAVLLVLAIVALSSDHKPK
jgi:hypothetical protein